MKKRINFLGVLLLILSPMQTYSQEMELADIQEIENRLSKLDSIPLNWFDNYLKSYPNSDYLLGMKYYNISFNGSNEEAKKELTNKIRSNIKLNNGTFVNLALGAIETNNNNVSIAIKYYNKSYLLDTNEINKWIRIELYYNYLQGNLHDGKGVDYLLEAIRIDQDFELALIELANHYILDGSYSAAQKILEDSQFDLLDYKKQFLLGNLQLEVNNIEKAKELFQKSISIYENSDSYIGLGYINQFYESDYVNAKIHYQKAIDVDPADPVSYKRLGVLELDLNNYSSADSLLSKAIEMDNDPDTYRELIHVNILKGNYDKAENLNNNYTHLFGMDHYSDFWEILILLLNERDKVKAQELLNDFYMNYSNKEREWLKNQLNEWGVNIE
ncbi:hypothetical protein GYB57_05880 [bacterium]|nr:hypothetical protein [bacterium]